MWLQVRDETGTSHISTRPRRLKLRLQTETLRPRLHPWCQVCLGSVSDDEWLVNLNNHLAGELFSWSFKRTEPLFEYLIFRPLSVQILRMFFPVVHSPQIVYRQLAASVAIQLPERLHDEVCSTLRHRWLWQHRFQRKVTLSKIE